MKKLVKVSPELAKEILENHPETRVLIIGNGRKTVKWINLNNMTVFAGSENNGCTYNIEDVQIYIMTEKEPLFNKLYNSYAIWNGSAWEDKNTNAYFYTIEKANNNGYNYE